MKYLKCCTGLEVIWLLATTIRVGNIDAFTLPVEVTPKDVEAKLITFNVTTPAVDKAESSDLLPIIPDKKPPDSNLTINENNGNLDEKPETTSELSVPSDEKLDKSDEKSETTSELPVPTDEIPKKSVEKSESTSDSLVPFDAKSEQSIEKPESASESPVPTDKKSDEKFDDSDTKPKTSSETSIQLDETPENLDVRQEKTSELPVPSDKKQKETVEKLETTSELPIKPDEKVKTSTVTPEQSVNEPDLSDNLTLSSDENLISNGSSNFVYQKQEVIEENEISSDGKLESVTELPIALDVKPESSSKFTIYTNHSDDLIIPRYDIVPNVTVEVPLEEFLIPLYNPENITENLMIWNATPLITEFYLTKINSVASDEKENSDEEFETDNTIPLPNSNLADIVDTATLHTIPPSIREEANTNLLDNQNENKQQLSREDIFCMIFVPLVVVVAIIIYVYVSCRKQGSYTVNYTVEEYSLEQAEEADSKL